MSKEIAIVNFSQKGGIKQFSDYLKDIFRKKKINFKYHNYKNFRSLYYFIKKNRNNLIVFTNNNMKIYYLIFLLNFDSVLILHDHKQRKGANIREKILLKSFNLFHEKFKKVIIHSKDGDVLNKYQNVVYSQMPFHMSNLRDGNDNKKIKLFFFGRIVEYKNIEFLINIFENKKIKDQFELVIAGKGSISPKKISKVKKNNSITLINDYIDDRLLYIFSNWCDFYILPYKDVTQTIIPEIAGFYQKPCILSNIEGFKEYLKEFHTYKIDIYDKNNAIEDLMYLYHDYSDYETKSKEAFRKYKESYKKWNQYIKEIIN